MHVLLLCPRFVVQTKRRLCHALVEWPGKRKQRLVPERNELTELPKSCSNIVLEELRLGAAFRVCPDFPT